MITYKTTKVINMELKKEWKDPIVMLEKAIMNIEQRYLMLNSASMSPTELAELNKEISKILHPYKWLLKNAKYEGYILNDYETQLNRLRPIFPL